MRIRVLSDLHLECRPWTPPSVEADVIVLAGDIHVSSYGLRWARRCFPSAPIIYVPGNHEFDGCEVEAELARLREEARDLKIALLDRNTVTMRGVRFVGATLWTDFHLDGDLPLREARAKRAAAEEMPDYQLIRFRERLLTPDDTQRFHARARAWLKAELPLPFAGRTVVVTHHLPHRGSIHPRYAGSALNAAFASDLSALFRERVGLWIHGHAHDSADYTVEDTRVVCNPRGYAPDELNQGFDPELVLEI